MTKRILFTLLLLLTFISAISQVFCSGSAQKKHPLYLKITEINNTNSDEVSRFSVSLIGVPHTSSRIDSAHIHRSDGAIYTASDIDGIDFQRYFQWEDDGLIDIELDFPKKSGYGSSDTLIVYSVYGPYRTLITTD